MSCPDWRRLDPAARDGAVSAQTCRWDEALRHLDSGCARCWQEAVAVDPTLIFRRLPAPELGPSEEAEEVAAARLAVAAMRTASRLEHRDRSASAMLPLSVPGLPAGRLRSARRGRSQPALRRLRSLHSLHSLQVVRWALAAGLTAMALLVGLSHGWHGETGRAGGVLQQSVSSANAAALSAAAQPRNPRAPLIARSGAAWDGAAEPMPAAARSSIEGLSRPEARVYQIDGPQMSVVMIVDEKLDV